MPRENPLAPKRTAHPPHLRASARGSCPDCEMERLQRWAREHRLMGEHDGPKDTVDTVLRLVAGMQVHIDSQKDRIAELLERLQQKDAQ